MMGKASWLAGACVLITAGVMGRPAQQGPAPAGQVDDAGHTLITANCTGCHETDIITSSRKSAGDWSATIDRMIGYGAPVSGEERQPIQNYLVARYGAGSPDRVGVQAQPDTVTPAVAAPIQVSPSAGQQGSYQAVAADCCAPTGDDHSKVGGNYGNHNYSSLDQIDRQTVPQLGGAWELRLEGGDDSSFQQSNLVVVDGVVYAESTQGSVVAIDGRTGEVKWRYRPDYGPTLRRGVAVGEGKVFTTKGGNHVVALDQATGAVMWDKDFSGEPSIGSLPTAITYYNGLILFGSANSARGTAFAVRAATGEIAWRFYGPPRPGQFGNESWADTSWEQGGAAPWLHPAIDPELNLVFWTFGNARAGAPLNGATREGANLFANSLVAIDADTGERVWHFQSVHHDIWDMDNVMSPVLIDMVVDGRPRQAVIYGSKTAMLYILDRTTGEPIFPIEERPVPQSPEQHTWPTQPFTTNEPLASLCPTQEGAGRVPPNYQSGCLFTPHLDDPLVHYPGTGGGADTSQYSYSHSTGLLYVGLGIVGIAQARTGSYVGVRPPGQERSGKIVAYDPALGRIAWQKETEWSLAHGNGVLSTAGDVLFIGQPDGYLLALDATNGKELWRFQTGAGVHTQPVTYQVDGEQYVAVLAGGNGLPYNSPKGDRVWAFRIGGTVPPATVPPPPPRRQPVAGEIIEGAAVSNTITLGRAWAEGRPGAEELRTPTAVAPQILRVSAGTTVTFTNPASNVLHHCASQFFEGLFDFRLAPGENFRFTFEEPGEYFFNDCAFPLATGKVIVTAP